MAPSNDDDPLNLSTSIDESGRGDNVTANEDDFVPLDQRVISVVRDSPNHVIRPAHLATALGISVNDACAELCGLLQAVGSSSQGSATFTFDRTSSPPVMVFTFPKNFEALAYRKKRRDTVYQLLMQSGKVLIRFIKVVTAFGLLLSLAIVSIAAIMGMIAALIALSRAEGGHGRNNSHHRTLLMHQIRSMCYTARQLLWCYALLAPVGDYDDGGDPFLREVAYDLPLFSSVFCGNPSSFFWWIRAREWQQRRRVNRNRGCCRSFFSSLRPRQGSSSPAAAGWSGRSVRVMESDVEGVSLVQRGPWRDDLEHSNPADRLALASGDTDRSEDHGNPTFHGVLSVAVEFLFGPTPFDPGPPPPDRWKLRALAIVNFCRRRQALAAAHDDQVPVPLIALLPYADEPPMSLSNSARVTEAVLPLVAHFNGIPARASGNTDKSIEILEETSWFTFPELLAERHMVEQNWIARLGNADETDDGDTNYLSILCRPPHLDSLPGPPKTPNGMVEEPPFLHERIYRLTRLPPGQFIQCAALGALNLIGVWWLGMSLRRGGVLEVPQGSWLSAILLGVMVPVLRFYSFMFFALPIVRFTFISLLNHFRSKRNRRRQEFAEQLSKMYL
jgi:hypothetical protein